MPANSGDPWFRLMVGHWWTPEIDLGVVRAAATKRHMNVTAWQSFSEQLRNELSGSLSPELQKGITAENLRDTFAWGADQAGRVAKVNEVIGDSHCCAHRCASELNSRLETIAAEGKAEIDQIQASKDMPLVKLGRIVDVVLRSQQDANTAAAPNTQNVFEAMQNILDQRGVPLSARQFCQQNGIDTTRLLGSPNKETVTQQVKGLLGPCDSLESSAPGVGDEAFGSPAGQGPSPSPASAAGGPTQPYSAPGPQAPFGDAAPQPAAQPQQYGAPIPQAPPGPAASAVPRAPLPSSGPSPAVPSASSPPPLSGLPNCLPANTFNPSAMGSVPSTNALAPGLNPAASQGAPLSGAFNNGAPLTSPVQPQIPAQAMSDLPASTMLAAAHAPAVDAPPPPPAPALSNTASPALDPGATYLAGPTPAQSTAAQSAAAAAPAGPLPSYGSDIRAPTLVTSTPTAPSSPVTTPSGPSTYSPTSAPVGSSAAASGPSQPAVIRQPAGSPTGHPAPAGVGEQAVASAAGGGAAGAASAQAHEKARLQRLVDFVARQEPRLRWVAGDRADGTTVLITDLAGGWIPPGILIPSVVTLLEPAERRGDLEAVLGPVEASASYTPLHYLPEPDDKAEPTATSLRPRHVPAVDDLGWELSQATKYRDGLPQMAHTIARAAFANTGLIDVEMQLLNQHLTKLREDVIGSYPADVDAAAVSNWQLLAAIDALASTDAIGANYHFAWFQALNRVP